MTQRVSRLLVVVAAVSAQAMCADGASAQLNHFVCYQRPRLTTRLSITLDDALGLGNDVRLSESKRFCLPADHDDQDPTAPDDPDHLAGYRMKQVEPHFLPHKNWVVKDEFGLHVLNIVKPDQMLVPAVLSLTEPPALSTLTVDHFKCYQSAYSQYRAFGIKVEDRFGITMVDIKKPLRVCLPGDKNGEGILDRTQAMMCYAINVARGSARPILPGVVFARDALDGTSFSALVRPRELCVPAEVQS